MNILFSTGMRSMKYGGFEKSLVKLAGRISDGGGRFYVQYESFPVKREFINDLNKTGAEIFVLNTSGNKFLTLIRMINEIRKRKIDIVHTNFNPAKYLFVIAATLCRTRKIISHFRNMESGKPKTGLKRNLVFNLSTNILAVSNGVGKELLENGAAPEKLRIVHNATSFFDKKMDKVSARKQLGLPIDKTIVLSMAWDGYVKGVDLLIRAFGRIASDIDNLYLCIVGSAGNNKENLGLVEYLGIKDRVSFPGIRNDIEVFIAASNIYVQPSRLEACSVAVLEAMAGKLPIVAFNVGGNPDIVEDGVTGFLASPEDIINLSEKIKLIAKNPEMAASMGKESGKKVLRSFTFEVYLKNIMEIYKSDSPKMLSLDKEEKWNE